MITISPAASVVASASGATSSTDKLVKLANGEYTASSVTADPTDADKLGLVKEKDGNYGTEKPKVEAARPAVAQAFNRRSSACNSADRRPAPWRSFEQALLDAAPRRYGTRT